MPTRRLMLALALVLAMVAAPSTGALAAPHAPIKTVQTRPIALHGKVRSVVGQATISRGGRLVIRLAGPDRAGVAGAVVLARTHRDIAGLISNLRRAKLTMKLNRDHTGSVLVIGPRNRREPDSVLTEIRWRVRTTPRVTIVAE